MDPLQKAKFNEVLKLLLAAKVDCRRFNNLRMVFLAEDQKDSCKIILLILKRAYPLRIF